MTPRRALGLWLLAMAVVHGALGAWQPVIGDDWTVLTWDRLHDASWLADHVTWFDIASYAIVHSPALHAAVCALVEPALVLGVFAVAMRRLPRDRWADTLGVIAASALIWIAQPRAGMTWLHHAHVAGPVCGCAAAAWLVAALRCGWRVGRAGCVAVVIGGLIAGASTPQIGIATLVGLALAVRRRPASERPGWPVWALGALAVGSALVLIAPPHLTVMRVINHGFEINLNLLNVPIREAGQAVSLLLLLTAARLGLAALRAAAPGEAGEAGDAALPTPRESLGWLAGWFAICVGCLFGPRYSEGILLPATLVIVAGALPYVYWLCESRMIRRAVIAIVIGVHAVAWPYGLVMMHGLHDEFADRLARIARTPSGAVAVIAPYSQLRPNAWFYGEDWESVDRELAGITLFGLRDIVFETMSRPEANPEIAVHLEQSGLTPGELAAWGPRFWGRAPVTARTQLVSLARHAARADQPAELRLVVDGLTFPALRGRPIELATAAHGKLTSPEIVHATTVDANDRYRLTAAPAFATSHPETYIFHGGSAEVTAYDRGAYWVPALVGGAYAVIACEPTRCLLLDAFVPRLW